MTSNLCVTPSAFDPNTRTFNGTPTTTDVGVIDIKAIATDSTGALVEDTFTLTVQDASNFNVINGDERNNALTGTAGADDIKGFAGNDYIQGLAGNDLIDGGSGRYDRLFGGSGNDVITDPDGTNGAHGELGNDTINVTFAATWDDDTNLTNSPRSDGKITGGYGNDTITVTMNNNKFFLSLKGDEAVNNLQEDGSDKVTLLGNYQNSQIALGGGADIFNGGKGSDKVSGGTGDDILLGLDGNDILLGEAGNDTLSGGNGYDVMLGGSGNDIFVLATGKGADLIGDFKDTKDLIGLSGGLRYSDLKFNQTLAGAVLSVTNTNEILAVLGGVNSNVLSAADFTAI